METQTRIVQGRNMETHQLINQTSGDVEYYTPPEILIAAREMLGTINLDPASSKAANERVKASNYYTMADDALRRPWIGTVWMNHPFSKKEPACEMPPGICLKQLSNPRHVCHPFPHYGNAAWINKLIEEYTAARSTQALCITYACTSEAWFRPLLRYPQCFLTPRTNYLLPDGTVKKGVTKGSVVTYFGPHNFQFRAIFESIHKLGVVKI